MKEEIKIRIENPEETESCLLKCGAKFVSERNVIDTYFNQPGDDVLKITEDERGVFLNTLKSNGVGFDILPKTVVKNLEESISLLSSEFGIQTVLKKKVRHFSYQSYDVTLNLIEGVGNFLVLEGDSIDSSVLTQNLKISNPKFIRVPFNKVLS